jgi:hypothetical protein
VILLFWARRSTSTWPTPSAAIRARALREAAGTITGHASGTDPETARDVLTDVLAVLGGDAGLQWADLAAAVVPVPAAVGRRHRRQQSRPSAERARRPGRERQGWRCYGRYVPWIQPQPLRRQLGAHQPPASLDGGQHLHLHLGGLTPAERAEVMRQLRDGQ